MREARVLRGYTQQALARVAGLSQSAIASYESDRRHSSRASRRLARALQVQRDWLETGKAHATSKRHPNCMSPGRPCTRCIRAINSFWTAWSTLISAPVWSGRSKRPP
nr:helix-turn-helix transcriptional regulator [Bordetella holmesii]